MSTDLRPLGRRVRKRWQRAAVALALGLAGCRSVDPTAGLSPGAEIAGGAPAASASAEAAPAPVTAAATAGSIGPVQFLPVVGAPASVIEMLSQALAAEAERAGVAIAPSDAPVTPLRLKGYLSALGEGREIAVVYVWDVVDPADNRVGRIQGQERAPAQGSGAGPWAAVPQATLSAIARRTMGELARMKTAG